MGKIFMDILVERFGLEIEGLLLGSQNESEVLEALFDRFGADAEFATFAIKRKEALRKKFKTPQIETARKKFHRVVARRN